MEKSQRYYILSKDADPLTLVEFVRTHFQISEIKEIGDHLFIDLMGKEVDEYDEEYGATMEGKVDYFPYGKEHLLEKWINENGYDHTDIHPLPNGYLVRIWSYQYEGKEEIEDKWELVVPIFMMLSPVWFILTIVFACLYFFGS